jgi:hypothetical protein
VAGGLTPRDRGGAMLSVGRGKSCGGLLAYRPMIAWALRLGLKKQFFACVSVCVGACVFYFPLFFSFFLSEILLFLSFLEKYKSFNYFTCIQLIIS